MTLQKSLAEVSGPTGDSVIPLFLPAVVLDRCNELILAALKDHDLPHAEPPIIPALKPPSLEKIQASFEEQGIEPCIPAFWRVDSIRAWQLIDRRIDEWVKVSFFIDSHVHVSSYLHDILFRSYEILWAFRAANAVMSAEIESRANLLITQLSKRAIRETLDDEMGSFSRWIGTPVPEIGFSYG